MNVFETSPRLEETAPEVHTNALVNRAAYHLNDYRATGRPHCLAAAEDMTRRIASLWHAATGTGRQTTWLQVARYAIELVACRNPRDMAFEHNPSHGIFGDGLPLEKMAPQAHQDILSIARRLAYHRRRHSPNDYAKASDLAQRAAATLHQDSGTGNPTVWLQVVLYLVELHAYTVTLEDRARN